MKTPHKAEAVFFGGHSTSINPGLDPYFYQEYARQPKPRVALFDMDEVVLIPERFYPTILGDKYDFKSGELVHSPKFGAALEGKANLVNVLAEFPKLDHLSREELEDIVVEWCRTEGVVDYAVIDHILELKSQGIVIAAATNNFRQKCEYIQNDLLPNVFDVFLSSSSLGHQKPKPEFFLEAMAKLKQDEELESLQPEEIVFFDDKKEYIKAAQKLGIDARIYTKSRQIRRLVHEQAYVA